MECVKCWGHGQIRDVSLEINDTCDKCDGRGEVPGPVLTWRDGTVRRIAERIYAERRWEECPILADALQEAGCEDEGMLMHLRGYEECVDITHDQAGGNYWCPRCGGTEEGHEGWMPLRWPHTRGCWSLDLLLGKR